jgi:hypothetical protein
LGLAAFESLHAEQEPWLAEQAYILPPDFELMAGGRSIIVYGQPGSGKTALRTALEYRAQSSTPIRLVVHWRPSLPTKGSLTGTPAARAQLAQVLNACARALLDTAVLPRFDHVQAPDWAHQTLAWFVQTYADDNLVLQVAPLLNRANDAGRDLLQRWAMQPAKGILDVNTSVEIVIARLVEALSTIGMSGIWVMADGAERLAEEEPERLTTALKAFLSNLTYFEQSPFFYKLTLPLSLEPELRSASSIVRRRVFVHQLQWTPELLTQIVVRRIAAAIGASTLDLNGLYAPENKKSKLRPKSHPIQAWLTNGAGATPLEWLHFATPLAITHIEHCQQGRQRPLTREEWIEVRKRMPLRLELDDNDQITVGKRTIGRLPPTEQSVLRYLMKHEGQICSKEELYNQAYLASGDTLEKRQTQHVPQPAESLAPKKRMDTKSAGYSDIMDTVLWRLREAIEPDMDDPIFIQTYRGQGIMLQPHPLD